MIEIKRSYKNKDIVVAGMCKDGHSRRIVLDDATPEELLMLYDIEYPGVQKVKKPKGNADKSDSVQ